MRLGDDRHLGPGEPNMVGAQVGPFTIVRPLGEGRMGAVYLAEHAVLKTQRAVKILSPELGDNALVVRRFVDEARAAARLRHRNLMAVHDVGQLASGAWFIVLDYLDGGSLARRIAGQRGAMPLDQIVHIVREIASGLQVAHDQRILHRDLRPEQVFLDGREGDPHPAVVLEFGVVQLGDDPAVWPGGRSCPDIGQLGTYAYMPPEQLRGSVLTPAADVFALGVIAYQLSTGGWFPYQYGESRAGYSALSATEIYHRQMSGPPIDPRERFRELPARWVEAILAAISIEPAQRLPTARGFALLLAAALPASGISLVEAGAELDAGYAAGPARPIAAAAIGSRYRLGDRLGTGGMAEVFSATVIGAEGFARRVAIKRVLSGLSQIPAFATMFVAEAQIASRLAHPNIVSVLDFARDAEDRLYLVMEYIDGKDLASVLTTGAIDPALAIFILVEMLRALGYAHDLPLPPEPLGARGVIHRDVSPQNLLLSYEGAVKVSDFGLAKVRAASGCVRSDTVRGKPSYMSPEQIAGEPLDGRSDLYAAGVILWEMLADRPLFTGTAKEITAQVMFKEIARPSCFRDSVPADLETVAMTLLAHDRDDRYATAEAAIDALLCCADAPRDGRGELAQLLAARFPTATRARGPRKTGAASEPRPPRTGRVTVGSIAMAASSAASQAEVRPRRGVFAATLGMAALCAAVAGAVLARGEVAQSKTADRAGPPPAPRVVAAPAVAASEIPSAAPADAGVADARAGGSPAGRPPSAELATPRPGRRERIAASGRTGELAIIVRPWAMIWLNGKPSGQTPFRAAVPVGRYRVRLANDDVGHDEITTVTVEADRTATVERIW